MLTTVIKEKLNRGLGQVIKGPDFATNIGAPEANGGLTDTMVDRALIEAQLKALIAELSRSAWGEYSLREMILMIYVDFVRGDPTLFKDAHVLASKKPMAAVQGLASFDLFSLGTVKKVPFTRSYRYTPPGSRALKFIQNRLEMREALTALGQAANEEAEAVDMARARRDMVQDLNDM